MTLQLYKAAVINCKFIELSTESTLVCLSRVVELAQLVMQWEGDYAIYTKIIEIASLPGTVGRVGGEGLRGICRTVFNRKYPAMVNILEDLTSLLSPSSETTLPVSMVLSLCNVCLEHMDRNNADPAFEKVLGGDFCKWCLWHSQTEDLRVLSEILRAVFNLFFVSSSYLRVQLEVFLQSVHLRLLHPPPSPSNSEDFEFYEKRTDMALDSLLTFCYEPGVLRGLYVNYDCDLTAGNLFEDVVTNLCDKAEAGNEKAQWGVLAVIDGIGLGMQNTPTISVSPPLPSSTTSISPPMTPLPPQPVARTSSSGSICVDGESLNILTEMKRHKSKLLSVTSEFNNGNRNWVPYAVERGVIQTENAGDVGRFLFEQGGVDKTKLGEYLSKGPAEKYPFNAAVLEHYSACFDFSKLTFDESLRVYLRKFRMPGEAQCIDRIMEAFSQRLHECYTRGGGGEVGRREKEGEPEITTGEGEAPPTPVRIREEIPQNPFRNSDAAFILSFSTIMLNTDLHNENMKEEKRMKVEEFVRNNRGINDGQDLPEEFLINLYNSIKEQEIQLHEGDIKKKGIEGAVGDWGELVADGGGWKEGEGVEKDMFTTIAAPTLSALGHILATTQSPQLLLACLSTFSTYCSLSSAVGMHEEFNDALASMMREGRRFVERVRGKCDQPWRGEPVWLDGWEGDNATDFRGLLALKTSLHLTSIHLPSIRLSFLLLLDLLYLLRSLGCLGMLGEVEDFEGMERSCYAEMVEGRRREHEVSMREGQDATGWLGGMVKQVLWGGYDYGSEQADDEESLEDSDNSEPSISTREAIRKVFEVSGLDSALLAPTSNPFITRTLLSHRSIRDKAELVSWMWEDQAVICLEIATRGVKGGGWEEWRDEILAILEQTDMPYLVERGIVNVLKTFIHLYDDASADVKKDLLNLVNAIGLIKTSVFRHVSNRVAAGISIVLRTCKFVDASEYAVVLKLCDRAAEFRAGRGFVAAALDAVVDEDKDQLVGTGGWRSVVATCCKLSGGDYEGDLSYRERAQKMVADLWSHAVGTGMKLDFGIAMSVCQCLDTPELLQRAIGSVGGEQMTIDVWVRLFREVFLTREFGEDGQEDDRMIWSNMLGRVVLVVVFVYGRDKEGGGEDLKGIVKGVIKYLGDNARNTRAAEVAEASVQIANNMGNVFQFPEFQGEGGIGEWGVGCLTEEGFAVVQEGMEVRGGEGGGREGAGEGGEGGEGGAARCVPLPPPPLSSQLSI
ncbi:hypothetical protein TrCOL_g2864 [Triparma columacea]|uniref:SEC7 domain-containing protein n=1 Tax=Triparma columacea TaxID=722753 RepID=A0A9W7GHE1_9STRA|nr:hypothetical protein TrCOL_g2864 [Triparma columacea]